MNPDPNNPGASGNRQNSAATPIDPASLTMAICLCTYNRSEKVLPTLRALAAQTRLGDPITRILIIDNNSRDNTADIIRSFIEANPTLPLELHIEASPGKSQSIRLAFAETDESIIAIIDDDCIPEPDWAINLYTALAAQPRAGIVGGKINVTLETLPGKDPPRVATRYISTFGPQCHGSKRIPLTQTEDFLGGASQAIRRQAMLDSHWLEEGQMTCLRDAKLAGGEDVELSYMVRCAGWQLWYEPAAAMQHMIPPSRQTLAEIARLRLAMATTEPMLKWMAHNKPGTDWVDAHLKRAHKQYRKTLFLEWRPTRRAIRLAERSGRRIGWGLVAQQLKQ